MNLPDRIPPNLGIEPSIEDLGHKMQPCYPSSFCDVDHLETESCCDTSTTERWRNVDAAQPILKVREQLM